MRTTTVIYLYEETIGQSVATLYCMQFCCDIKDRLSIILVDDFTKQDFQNNLLYDHKGYFINNIAVLKFNRTSINKSGVYAKSIC